MKIIVVNVFQLKQLKRRNLKNNFFSPRNKFTKNKNSANSALESQQAEIRALEESLAKEQEKIIGLENYTQGRKTFDS